MFNAVQPSNGGNIMQDMWRAASVALGGRDALKGTSQPTPDQVLTLDLQAFFDEAIARGIGALSTLSTLKQDAATASPELRKRIEAAISAPAWTNVTDGYVSMVEDLADKVRAEKDSLGQA
jgi:hypothetical protein